jgi:chemotaxis protein methyltransferase CheR
MNDTDCVTFLRWALPQLELHWSGFRKVHRQVCKRLRRRMRELGLTDFAAYRARLEANPAEWRVFDGCGQTLRNSCDSCPCNGPSGHAALHRRRRDTSQTDS